MYSGRRLEPSVLFLEPSVVVAKHSNVGFLVPGGFERDRLTAHGLHGGVAHRVVTHISLVYPVNVLQLVLFESHLPFEVQEKSGNFIHNIFGQTD